MLKAKKDKVTYFDNFNNLYNVETGHQYSFQAIGFELMTIALRTKGLSQVLGLNFV